MVWIARGARFQHDIGVTPQPFLDQAVMDGTGAEQGMDGDPALGDAVVGQHQDYLAALHGVDGLLAQLCDGLTQGPLFGVGQVDDLVWVLRVVEGQ